ncbi:alpha/beta hydrolase [Comamonas sp. NLF-1-9]|uniref:PHA/PHB synthase family protein n=1 Tax=Comamonas sp. NLF-1-9 TaxID=2853163 RepID=UPI001C44793C|nr:class I poly(R)-hydroxyalkanoic acid synthase [Comamonas sp. NLF-1-9]QXL85362.1 class I poly(R)-hydroxyalkanoic acid synthase [Comamonas sp. NLF-1-9]
MSVDTEWARNAGALQQLWAQAWGQMLQAYKPVDVGALAAGLQPLQPVSLSPEKLAQLQQEYLDGMRELWGRNWGGAAPEGSSDRRFAAESWSNNPVSAFTVAAYELQARTLRAMTQAVQADEKTRERIRFSVEQYLAASAPSNFLAFNVEAQRKALETRGESLAQGMANLLKDIQQGHISMTDESQFEVGRNVATTEGAVVYQNELFQLIEYKPLTAKVHERPFLMVPPCINKYYILDLQPDNSLIRYAVQQGQRTFVVSWRNPDMTLADKTWDDYIEDAVIEAIRTVKAITGAPQINTLGFCVGGTMLANALAVLAARGDDSVASSTFLTTLIDFTETGVLDVFIDENFVRLRELQMGQGGLMKGQDLASTFSFLRPNDLVWNYVVGNYLKGETPPAFDLLYWNCDSTNLPGPYYAWYLRNFYLENRLVQPGGVTVCGEEIDLAQVKLPVYIYGSREDHIVPIGGAYASTQVLPGKKRFVMGASGHIAGVINPPAKKKRSHWLREDGKFPSTVDAWIKGASEHPGSWWEDWAAWLKGHAGKQIAAPKSFGKAPRYKPLEPAPGSYVRQKA